MIPPPTLSGRNTVRSSAVSVDRRLPASSFPVAPGEDLAVARFDLLRHVSRHGAAQPIPAQPGDNFMDTGDRE